MVIAACFFIPLVWIRKMAYFTATNLISLLVILLSLILILGSGVYQVREDLIYYVLIRSPCCEMLIN